MVTDSSDDVNTMKVSSLIGYLQWKGVIDHLINAFFCKVVSFAVLKMQSVCINTAFFSNVKMKKKKKLLYSGRMYFGGLQVYYFTF